MVQVFHIFVYLKKNHNTILVFDPSYPEIHPDTFQHHDWTKFYGNVKEAILLDIPKPLRKEVFMRCFVDADHASEILTRRSRTGFIIFLQMAPIYYCSKHQNSVEISIFGSDFMAMKHAIEKVSTLRYKLRMLRIPFSDLCYVYGDNKSVFFITLRYRNQH